jgi:outer membrane protein OmpA-like peptidoglycan-associated protein
MTALRTRCARVAGLLMVVAACLGGCATRSPSTLATTVVLLADEDGRVGAVSVSSASGTQWLDGALSRTVVERAGATPSKAGVMSVDALNKDYGALLKAQPQKPRTFILHFLLDRTELTEESQAALPVLFAALRERKPDSIVVFGHADATGSPARNLKLSADRAEAAANLLRRNAPALDDIEVQYFGETRPLKPSGPNASEARNRRVEIMIF